MSRPKLILLDEPSMGLAPQIVEEIFEIVEHHNVKVSRFFSPSRIPIWRSNTPATDTSSKMAAW
jgi:hypothetical protein